jgi:hypothetical protein
MFANNSEVARGHFNPAHPKIDGGTTAMVTALVYFTIYVIVLGLVIWLLLYVIDAVPLPDPFNRVARVCIIVIGVLILILLLLNLIGLGPPPRLGRAWGLLSLIDFG